MRHTDKGKEGGGKCRKEERKRKGSKGCVQEDLCIYIILFLSSATVFIFDRKELLILQ